jgi:hypothetical protein
MIVIPCTACAFALRVIGNLEEIDALVGRSSRWWPGAYPCPQCQAACPAMLEVEAEADALAWLRIVDVGPQEAYAALEGFGLPYERSCKAADVRELLSTHRVSSVTCRDVGNDRSCVEHIELEDGTRLYFGASAVGAVVYRITRKVSYVERATPP